MKREIKFRGLRADGKQWVYGHYVVDYIGDSFITDGVDTYKVSPETVGQFTGLKDKDGADIYEGDVLLWTNASGVEDSCGVVAWNNSLHGYVVEIGDNYEMLTDVHYANEGVIGNVHDNPDLI